MKTSVSMTLVIADQAAVRAIISPPCFGARPVQRLRWLGSSSKAPEDLERDPIWRTRQRLRLVFGGEALQTAIRCPAFISSWPDSTKNFPGCQYRQRVW